MNNQTLHISSTLQNLIKHLTIDSLAGKKIFMTGSTGFFGFWLLSLLAMLNTQKADINVSVLSRDPQRFLALRPQFKNQKWLSFVQGDIKDFDLSDKRYDMLIHAATSTSTTDPAVLLNIFDDIVEGTRNVLNFAIKAGINRTLLISSGAVYGPQPVTTITIPEDAIFTDLPDNLSSTYGKGKRIMESLGVLYAKKYGLQVITARCFSFVGHGLPLNSHLAISNFIQDALSSDSIIINGDGTPIRSYLYCGDLVIWLLMLLINGEPGRIYNVGSDLPISMSELANLVRDIFAPDKPVKILGQPYEENGRNSYVPDIQRARHELGLDIWTPLADAIRLTVVDRNDVIN